MEITSEAIMPLPEVLRNSTVTAEDSATDTNAISPADKEIENNSISKITQK